MALDFPPKKNINCRKGEASNIPSQLWILKSSKEHLKFEIAILFSNQQIIRMI
jgi:hypothetical protein